MRIASQQLIFSNGATRKSLDLTNRRIPRARHESFMGRWAVKQFSTTSLRVATGAITFPALTPGGRTMWTPSPTLADIVGLDTDGTWFIYATLSPANYAVILVDKTRTWPVAALSDGRVVPHIIAVVTVASSVISAITQVEFSDIREEMGDAQMPAFSLTEIHQCITRDKNGALTLFDFGTAPQNFIPSLLIPALGIRQITWRSDQGVGGQCENAPAIPGPGSGGYICTDGHTHLVNYANTSGTAGYADTAGSASGGWPTVWQHDHDSDAWHTNFAGGDKHTQYVKMSGDLARNTMSGPINPTALYINSKGVVAKKVCDLDPNDLVLVREP